MALVTVLAGVLGFVPPRSLTLQPNSIDCTRNQKRQNERSLQAFLPPDASVMSAQVATTIASNSLLWISDASAMTAAEVDAAAEQVAGLSKETAIAVFVVGLIPFGVATVEFWRRIAVGASFGTAEPVVFTIGEDDAPSSSRGKQVLGKDALVTAYIIFAVVAVVLGIVLISVLTSPDPMTMQLTPGSA